jgi:hypothetical protein
MSTAPPPPPRHRRPKLLPRKPLQTLRRQHSRHHIRRLEGHLTVGRRKDQGENCFFEAARDGCGAAAAH